MVIEILLGIQLVMLIGIYLVLRTITANQVHIAKASKNNITHVIDAIKGTKK